MEVENTPSAVSNRKRSLEHNKTDPVEKKSRCYDPSPIHHWDVYRLCNLLSFLTANEIMRVRAASKSMCDTVERALKMNSSLLSVLELHAPDPFRRFTSENLQRLQNSVQKLRLLEGFSTSNVLERFPHASVVETTTSPNAFFMFEIHFLRRSGEKITHLYPSYARKGRSI
jgi:hypothetical protein